MLSSSSAIELDGEGEELARLAVGALESEVDLSAFSESEASERNRRPQQSIAGVEGGSRRHTSVGAHGIGVGGRSSRHGFCLRPGYGVTLKKVTRWFFQNLYKTTT